MYNDIKESFFEKGYVHIPNQSPVSLNELKDMCESFGKIFAYKKERLVDSKQYAFIKDEIYAQISNEGMFADNELNWHKDMMLVKPWYAGSLLYAETDSTTPTNFCYTLNTSLGNKVYEHSCFSTSLGFDTPDKEKEYAKRFRDNPKLAQRVGKFVDNYLDKKHVQQVDYITEHPITKEQCIITSPATMATTPEQYDFLVNDMFDNNERFSHTWKKYDILIWDNYKLMHHRPKVLDVNRKLVRLNFNYDNIKKE